MAKNITKVPDGPLIKKKGPFKGSTLKSGGKIKKAQSGEFLTQEDGKYTSTKKVKTANGDRYYQGKSPSMSFAREIASERARRINDSIPKAKLSARALEVMNQKNGGPIKKAQLGTLVKKGAKAVGLGTAAAAGASSASSCSSGHCFHKKSRWTHNGRRKNGGPVKKAQASKVIDKTAVKKPDAKNIMKRDNEMTVRNLKNTASYRKNYADKAYQAARSFLVDDNNETMYKFANESAKKDDSLSNVALRKAREAKINPKFKVKAKAGAMIKRADGSTSQRGLWDNIRANKGSGKKPTAAMLKQEKKIKAKK